MAATSVAVDSRGVPLVILQEISAALNVWGSGDRCSYNGVSGIRLPSNVFQARTYERCGDEWVIVRSERELTHEEWETVTPLKAAVGDRILWNGQAGTVFAITGIKYTVRPAGTEQHAHEANYASWDWGGAIIMKETDAFARDLRLATKDACEEIVKPKTFDTQSTVVELLRLQGKATKFISHAWNSVFQDVVLALGANEASGDIFWFDLCSLNQHTPCARDSDWWQTSLKALLADIGRTALILSPWEAPAPLTRLGCLWEIYLTLRAGHSLQVLVMEKASFFDALLGESAQVMDRLCQVDVENARAGSAAHDASIKAAIVTSGIDCRAFNETCRAGVRQSVIGTMERVASEKSGPLMFVLGRLSYSDGEVEKALAWYESALQGYAGDASGRGNCYMDMAQIYCRQGNLLKSLECYNHALSIAQEQYGPEHLVTASIYSRMGAMCDDQEDYARAIGFYEKVLQSSNPPGADVVLAMCNNMAFAYCRMGDFERALEHFERAFETAVKIKGQDHPDVGEICNNVAIASCRLEKFSKALEYFDKTLLIQSKSLGPKHPDVGVTLGRMYSIYKGQEK